MHRLILSIRNLHGLSIPTCYPDFLCGTAAGFYFLLLSRPPSTIEHPSCCHIVKSTCNKTFGLKMLPQSFPAIVSVGLAEALPAENVSRDEPLTQGIALNDINVAGNSSTAETHVIAEMQILKVVSSDHQMPVWWQWWLHNKGVVLVLTSEMFGALMNTSTRLLETSCDDASGMHPFQVSKKAHMRASFLQTTLILVPHQILFARMAVTFVLSSVYMRYSKVPYFPLGMKEVRRLLLFRGVAGFVGVYGLYCRYCI